MRKKPLTAAAAMMGATALLVLGAVAPAQAYGSNNWIGGLCGGGYAGSSSYTTSTSISHANTARSGTGCGVAVAIRYYAGAGNYTEGGSSDIVATSRAAVAYGGFHYLGVFSPQST